MVDPDTLITIMDEFDAIAAKYGYQIGIASSNEDDEDNTIIRIMLEKKDAESRFNYNTYNFDYVGSDFYNLFLGFLSLLQNSR